MAAPHTLRMLRLGARAAHGQLNLHLVCFLRLTVGEQSERAEAEAGIVRACACVLVRAREWPSGAFRCTVYGCSTAVSYGRVTLH